MATYLAVADVCPRGQAAIYNLCQRVQFEVHGIDEAEARHIADEELSAYDSATLTLLKRF